VPETGPLVAVLLIAATASALATAAWTAFARRRALLDLPGARRVHSAPTPRGGGIGIALLAVAGFCWLGAAGAGVNLWLVASGVGLFSLLGLVDDLRPLPASAKLVVQLVAAAILVAGLPTSAIAPALAWMILAVGCAYTVNVFNFMDGSNGLVAMQGLVIGLALALWPGQIESLRLAALVLAGACAGFLPFNLPRARVFLGDVGSHAIGATVFALLLWAWIAGTLSLPQCLLLLTPVALDSGHTLLRRALAGRKVWRAHREHLYQYAVRSGHSHAAVCGAFAAWTAASAFLAASGVNIRSSLVMWVFLILNWVLGTAAYCGLRRHWLNARMRGSRA
jgi:UDP-N-acetylmuramyl pentapeptide phosphotransferase/UDP-N-acetylglucosamine-1-phosphate transferase